MRDERQQDGEPGRVTIGAGLGRAVGLTPPRKEGDADRTSFYFHAPRVVLTAGSVEDARRVLAAAVSHARSGAFVVGFVTYEAAAAFEAAVRWEASDLPPVWFGVYDDFTEPPHPSERNVFRISNPCFSIEQGAYADVIARIRDEIHEGNVYQINFTAPLDFEFSGDPRALYRQLLERQPVPYPAYVDIGEAQILSCSPELFFSQDGRDVVARPMKGTAARGAARSEDDEIARRLASDAKSRAENVMIVDLLRNDLSRCCDAGSVRVPSLFTTELYETLIQMTSEIRGRLRSGCDVADVFGALFPCGSVTGAPKIRAMEILHALERGPRGVYCGAVGIIHRDRAAFNVAIRTAVIRNGRGRLGIGSGIVWDSDSGGEFDECLLKARFLTDLAIPPGVRLIETMRASGGEVALLDLHLDRIRSSARALGFAFEASRFRMEVARAAARVRDAKIRAKLSADGEMDVSASPIREGRRRWRAVVSDRRIDGSDLYRRHKTTYREAYEEAYRQAVEAGFDEVLFLNREGCVAEGSRTNVVAVFGDSWVTPPVRSGALPGVYRRHLLETKPSMQESDLTMKDLEGADELYLCNAVRGLVRTHLALAPEKIGNDVT